MIIQDYEKYDVHISSSEYPKVLFDNLSQFQNINEYCNINKHTNVRVFDIVFYDLNLGDVKFYGLLLINDDYNYIDILRSPFVMRPKSNKVHLWKKIFSFIKENNLIDNPYASDHFLSSEIAEESDYILYNAPLNRISELLALFSLNTAVVADYTAEPLNPFLTIMIKEEGRYFRNHGMVDIKNHFVNELSKHVDIELEAEVNQTLDSIGNNKITMLDFMNMESFISEYISNSYSSLIE